MLNNIRIGVIDRINQRHGEIISRAFGIMVKKHNDFCGCEYCIKLKEYVLYRRWQSTQRRIERDVDFYNLAVLMEERCRNIRLDAFVKKLKEEKDSLKIQVMQFCQ